MKDINKNKINGNVENNGEIDNLLNIGRDNNTNSYNTTINNNYYSSKDIQSAPVDPILNSANRTKLRQMVGKEI